MRKNSIIIFSLLSGIILFFLCWKAGSSGISWFDFYNAIIGKNADDRIETILFRLRLPRLLLSMTAGASLAFSGLLFQAMLRNPLAEPYVLGISGGAAAGAMIGIVCGFEIIFAGIPVITLFSFIGSLITIIFIYFFTKRRRGILPVHTMLLAGIALQAMLSAVVLFIQTMMEPMEMTRAFALLTGKIPSLEIAPLFFLFCVSSISFILMLPFTKSLNALSLGDDTALSLGVENTKLRKLIFFSASLLTGAFTAITGIIGFVGIIVPHILRLIFGADHRLLIPMSIIGGAIFLMVCDTIARTVASPIELPVGLITAITGGPFFLLLLSIRKSER